MATYYVSLSGNDSNPGTIGSPFLTFTKARSVIVAGDTVFVRAGTYSERIVLNNAPNPSGTSWSSPITYSAYNSEVVTIRNIGLSTTTGVNRYMIFKDFIIDGQYSEVETVYMSSGTSHIRVQNCEVKRATWQGFLMHKNSGGNCEILDCNIHLNGTPEITSGGHNGSHRHGIYCQSSNNLFDGNEFYNNTGFGITIFASGTTPSTGGPSNNIIRNNLIHHNHWWNGAVSPETFGSSGIGMDCGSNNRCYNNVIYSDFSGIAVKWGSPIDNKIYNNTIFNMTTDDAIDIGAGASRTVVKNNIVYGTHATIQNDNSSTVSSNNLVGVNPQFVNSGAANFRLQSSSPAINNGVVLSETSPDYDGVTRPQGTAYDMGAFEFVGGVAPDTTPPTGSVTFPPSSSTVSGTINITCLATDNIGIANVQFYLDGSPLGGPVT